MPAGPSRAIGSPDTGTRTFAADAERPSDGPAGLERLETRSAMELFRPLRQVIESLDETFTGRFDLERHRGRTPDGVAVRVPQRVLALTAAIWHNDHTGRPVMRALTTYDH